MNRTVLTPIQRSGFVALSALLGLLALALPAHAQTTDLFRQAAQFRFGQPNTALTALEAEIRSANPERRRGQEAELVKILQSPEATTDAKSWTCRVLRIVGSEQAVPALAALLSDENLSADAQFALRSIPGTKVDQALRKALARTKGLQKAGVVQTLGARQDCQALPLLAPLAGDQDPIVAEAALYALGHIGGDEALQAVQKAQVPERLRGYRDHALLLCAESLPADKKAEAAAVYRELYSQSKNKALRAAALRGLVRTGQAQATSTLVGALAADDARLRAAAAKALCEVADEVLVKTALAQFPAWHPEAQILVLDMIAHPAALPVIRQAISSDNEKLRHVVLAALGRLGDVSDIPVLLRVAVEQTSAAAMARKSLQTLRGPKIDDALLAAAKAETAGDQVEAIHALAGRNATNAVPSLLELARIRSPVRGVALQAVGQLAGTKDFPALVGFLTKSQGNVDQTVIVIALVTYLHRTADREGAATALVAAMKEATPEVQVVLLRLLNLVPCRQSMAALRSAADNSDGTVRDAAVRGLTAWPEIAALPDLERIAKTSSDSTHKALARRGLIRLLRLPEAGPPEQTVKQLGSVLTLTDSKEEKTLVLSALAEMKRPHPAALDLAAGCLSDPALEMEAAQAIVRLAGSCK